MAAQEGSASENHRESESYSTPKPLLWLKTQKLLLLGKKYTSKDPFERTSTAHQNHNFIFTPIVSAVRSKTLTTLAHACVNGVRLTVPKTVSSRRKKEFSIHAPTMRNGCTVWHCHNHGQNNVKHFVIPSFLLSSLNQQWQCFASQICNHQISL